MATRANVAAATLRMLLTTQAKNVSGVWLGKGCSDITAVCLCYLTPDERQNMNRCWKKITKE
jgi:hypothetical protein